MANETSITENEQKDKTEITRHLDDGRKFYVDHLEQNTTYNDPRVDLSESEFPETKARTVTITRHPELGYGFVAGSEKPVIIRFVTEGGPSVHKLLPGDEVLAVNDQDVSDASKDVVVQLVRSCMSEVQLTVCQPRMSDSELKSSILSAHKRARLRQNPTRVRFAEAVSVRNPLLAEQSSSSAAESCVPMMPNVIRVFLENGQTRSFKYDQSTTVQEVLESLAEKLTLRHTEYFALMLEHPQGPRSNKLSMLRKDEKLARIAARPGSQHFRCLLRLVFVPNEPIELYKIDVIAFQYYYQQCVNDVVAGRYAFEMRYEACIRLASLHMQQVAIDTKMTSPGAKVSLKAIEKEYGLGMFLPVILLENVKRKEIRKHLRYYLKRDIGRRPSVNANSLVPPSTQPVSFISVAHAMPESPGTCSHASSGLYTHDPSTYIQLKYIQTLALLPSFGGRTFCVTFRDTDTDMLMTVSPRQGLILRGAARSTEPATLLYYDLIDRMCVSHDTAVSRILSIHLASNDAQCLEFHIDKDDVDDILLLTAGYFSIRTGRTLPCITEETNDSFQDVPKYHGLHSVRPAGWNYLGSDDHHHGVLANEQEQRLMDFARQPPTYLDPRMQDASTSVYETEDVQVDKEDVFDTEGTGHTQPKISTTESELDIQQPNKFLRAKDSFLVNAPDRPLKKRTFLKARDSMLVHHKQHKPNENEEVPKMDPIIRTAKVEEVLSSSESESVSTPSQSPAKRTSRPDRPSNLASTPEHIVSNISTPPAPSSAFQNHRLSFGLQSPDTLPAGKLTDNDLQKIIGQCGIEGETLEELLLLFPDNFCTDAEIIDLTMIPSPSAAAPLRSMADTFQPTPLGPDNPNSTSPFADQGQSSHVTFRPESVRLASATVDAISPPTPFRDDLEQDSLVQSFGQFGFQQPNTIETEFNQDGNASSSSSTNYPSIAHNAKEFEEFLKRSTVPPPPPSRSPPSSNDGRRLSLLSTESVCSSTSKPVALPVDNKLPRTMQSESAHVANHKPHSIGNHNNPNKQSHFTFKTENDSSYHQAMNNNCSNEQEIAWSPVPVASTSSTPTMATPTTTTQNSANRLITVQGGELAELNTTPENDTPQRANVVCKSQSSEAQLNAINSAVSQTPTKSGTDVKMSIMSLLNPKLGPVRTRSNPGSPNMERLRHSMRQYGDILQNRDQTMRRYSTDMFSGLAPENERPYIRRMDLRHYCGLEVLQRGMSSVELQLGDESHDMEYKIAASQSPSIKERRRSFARVRSVDPHMASPGKNARRSPASQQSHHRADRVQLAPPPLKSIIESPSSPVDSSSLCSVPLSALSNSSSVHDVGNGFVNTNNEPTHSVDCVNAQAQIDVLLAAVHDSAEQMPSRSPRRSLGDQSLSYKTNLLNEAQRFAAATKVLVRQSSDTHAQHNQTQFESHLGHTLYRAQLMTRAGQALMAHATSLFHAQVLAAKLTECLHAFHATIECIQNTQSQSQPRLLATPQMKKLMRQSTTLAATLTQLIQAATGRMSGRPGLVDKRSLAVGRFNMRPGKRSIATGRFNLRPGKRSLAVGRFNMRPGKRMQSAFEDDLCSADILAENAQKMEILLTQIEEHSDYIKSCAPEGIF